MNDRLLFLCVGAFIGGIGGGIANDIRHMKVTQRVELEIKACEQDLPRSQHCRIIAIPVDKN